MKKRGWSTIGLILVDEHERIWTVAEAAQLLDETESDLRWLIRRLEIPPVGMQKKTGQDKRGRQPRAYRAIDLIRACDALSRAA